MGLGGGGGASYIEMVSSFLWREFSPLLDPVPELRLSSLEFAAFIIGGDPIGDLLRFGLLLLLLG